MVVLGGVRFVMSEVPLWWGRRKQRAFFDTTFSGLTHAALRPGLQVYFVHNNPSLGPYIRLMPRTLWCS